MGLQLIFAVEADKKSKSDWMYINSTIKELYELGSDVKINTVYMGSKAKYKKGTVEKEFQTFSKQYEAVSKVNRSIRIYCFDCDDYDSKREDWDFLNEANKFCLENGYEFVWFCKDVERVYWGEKVKRHEKRRKAEEFLRKKQINSIDYQKLRKKNLQYVQNSSNLLTVLDKYLTRKS